MENLFDKNKTFKNDLDLRVYTSNLLGQNPNLVLHGGGNTSLKSFVNNEEVLFVKGSGWDLSDIKPQGFAPVKMKNLLEMAKLPKLSDTDMVKLQREAMLDKTAPNPSVEAILHALIPYKFVDHTHADAVVCMTSSNEGKKHIKEIFANFLYIPYVMPGFILASYIYHQIKDINWNELDGIILENHGIFTFDDDAQIAYSKMIQAVSKAEIFLDKYANLDIKPINETYKFDISNLQKIISEKKGYEIFLLENKSDIAKFYSAQKNLEKLACRGVLTPEHVIRTKREPLILKQNASMKDSIKEYQENYEAYFNEFANDEIMLNSTPNYAVLENYGILCFGKDEKEANIINDIVSHTIEAVLRADKLGGFVSIDRQNTFNMEYWELEQAKLKKT